VIEPARIAKSPITMQSSIKEKPFLFLVNIFLLIS